MSVFSVFSVAIFSGEAHSMSFLKRYSHLAATEWS